ncbi:MAG: GNAT family N-acetyltransferase [Promethearchaeota archaeon]|jgi:N-acetylglutamate synthase-like GNAT family acetyltransferase
MDYAIRKAEPKDAKGIHEVILTSFEEFRDYYSLEGFTDTVMSEELALKRIKEMNLFVTVDLNDEIIGTIGWKKVSMKEGHIRGMAVHPQFQGKNSPAATLLQAVEDEARSQGCVILSLDTTEILIRAQNFYRKHGFKETGKTGDFYGTTIIEFIKEI